MVYFDPIKHHSAYISIYSFLHQILISVRSPPVVQITFIFEVVVLVVVVDVVDVKRQLNNII